jgi:signal transduction histidine kinase
LPAHTILLILTVFEDASGRRYRPRDVAAAIASAANAPTYGILSSYIGSGIVGGNLATYRSIGEDIASRVTTLLGGDASAPQIIHAASRPVIDWRQLQRWGIDASRLPGDVDLLYYTPTLWEAYRWQIILITTALVAQTLAILGLFYERRGRRAAEVQSRGRLLEVVHLNQSATAGALSASIAHELNQPLGAIRNNAAAAEIILNGDRPDLDLVRQIIADIRDDDQRAGDIIARLRGLLKKRSEIDWQEFDVNDVVSNSLQILRGEAKRRSVIVDCVQAERHLPVRADRIHLQQVILNIATNAMDAMLDSTAAQRRLLLQTGVAQGSKATVSISDTGRGIPADQLGRVFETFYTTKSHGTGLGLSIARTIVETYGGKIWADNRPEGGAVVSFVLPLVQS